MMGGGMGGFGGGGGGGGGGGFGGFGVDRSAAAEQAEAGSVSRPNMLVVLRKA